MAPSLLEFQALWVRRLTSGAAAKEPSATPAVHPQTRGCFLVTSALSLATC
jgi:hypothetical protein